MVCLGDLRVNTLYKGDKDKDNNNNNLTQQMIMLVGDYYPETGEMNIHSRSLGQ